MTTSAGISGSHLALKLEDILSRDTMFSGRFYVVCSRTKVAMAICLLAEICRNKEAYFSISDIANFLQGLVDISKITDVLPDTCLFKSATIESGGLVREGFRIGTKRYRPVYEITFGRGDDSLLIYVKTINAEEIGLMPGEPV